MGPVSCPADVTRKALRFFLFASAAMVAGCSDPSDSAATKLRSARLVDSVEFSNELIGTDYLRRVEVRTLDGVDTLPGVLTIQPPIVADSAVYGLSYVENRVSGAFRYSPSTGVENLPLPDDLFPFSTPRLSPDARHLAYLAMDSAGLGYATVVSWPSLAVVYRGPGVRLLETDAGVDQITWLDAGRFRIELALTVQTGGLLRIEGSVDGTVSADTISREALDRVVLP